MAGQRSGSKKGAQLARCDRVEPQRQTYVKPTEARHNRDPSGDATPQDIVRIWADFWSSMQLLPDAPLPFQPPPPEVFQFSHPPFLPLPCVTVDKT
ncbi:unnamed protein product [Effrenium voratum]|nr:unnamed protein product [Effrenium voratum]